MRHKIPAALTLSALFTGVAVAQSSDVDYSKLPPKPTEVMKQLSATGVSLTDAVAAAEQKVGGKAKSARFDFADPGATVIVKVYTADSSHTVVVDASTGEVKTDTTNSNLGLPGWDVPEGVKMTTTDSGLMYYDIVVGTGASPASPAAKVKVHYSGYLVDGKKFDSSVDRGQPITFPLSGVIKGWTEGVGSMKVGGKRKLIIPFSLAYGAGGRPPIIPPKALLIFDVELLDLPK